MNTSLDLEHLRTIVAIAECGGFGRAAAVRHISQPALSQHVRLLERNLQRKLFVRDGRIMRFTPAGEELLNEARHILAVHDDALTRLKADRKRSIVVGSTEHSAEQVLPEILRSFTAAFPDYTTRFEIARSSELAESVNKGSVDVALVLGPVAGPNAKVVGELPLRWYASPDWALPDEGDPLPLVVFDEPCQLRERAMRLLSEIGIGIEVAGQAATLDGVLAGVRAGLGVAMLPSAGGMPPGVVVRSDLPAAGRFGLHLVVRQGLNRQIEATATRVCQEFFDQRPHLGLTNGHAEEHVAPVIHLAAR